MDSSAYKDFKTSRGFNYHYYNSPARDGKITFLLLHGFPSISYDWHHQVAFFQEKGYGLVVPDMLGYGGTDKPTAPEAYRMSLMALDCVEILDEEKIEKVVAIGHDWGSGLASRLAIYHPDRFLAFGFLAVGYRPPSSDFNYENLLALTEKLFGYATFGYWEFFAAEGSHEIIEKNLESFYSLLFCADSLLWKEHVAPLGKAREWILSDKRTPVASYLSDKDTEIHLDSLRNGGLAGPLCWYKAMIQKLTPNEEADIPKEKYIINHPVFFGAALRDYVCIAQAGKLTTQGTCPNATVVDFDTDHWVMLAEPDKVNAELLKWIEGVEKSDSSSKL